MSIADAPYVREERLVFLLPLSERFLSALQEVQDVLLDLVYRPADGLRPRSAGSASA